MDKSLPTIYRSIYLHCMYICSTYILVIKNFQISTLNNFFLFCARHIKSIVNFSMDTSSGRDTLDEPLTSTPNCGSSNSNIELFSIGDQSYNSQESKDSGTACMHQYILNLTSVFPPHPSFQRIIFLPKYSEHFPLSSHFPFFFRYLPIYYIFLGKCNIHTPCFTLQLICTRRLQ